MRFLNFFKKQNWGIKIGYISLAISLLTLFLGLILIGSAKFSSDDGVSNNPSLIGNGFDIINNYGIHRFLTSQGCQSFIRLCSVITGLSSYPVAQLSAGIVFLVILTPISGIIAIMGLLIGYFKKWLYT